MTKIVVHNYLRWHRRLDEGFRRAEENDDDEVEVNLPNEDDKIVIEEDATGDVNIPWQGLRDYMAQVLR